MTLALQSQRSWPTESQKLLLRATLQDGAAAAEAWREWKGTHDFGTLDRGSIAIMPNLYLNLREQEISTDDSSHVFLAQFYKKTWINNLISKFTLINVSKILKESNIKVMIPKGFPLALFHYPDLGARYMGDIDLLIEPGDLAATAKVLQDNEWSRDSQLPPPGLAPFIHAASFWHPKRGSLDVHWVPFRVDSPVQSKIDFWNRTSSRNVDGQPIRVPDATNLLLQVCFHSRKLDSQATCRWIIDALTLINGVDDPVDWDAVVTRSQEADVMLPVRDALSYLHNEFGPILPEDTLEQFKYFAITKEHRDTYFEQMNESTVNRGFGELILSQWRRYEGVRRSRKESASWLGFVRYYTQFLKWRWQAPSLTQLPGTAARRLLNRLFPSKERIDPTD
jgi:hypothetical protein